MAEHKPDTRKSSALGTVCLGPVTTPLKAPTCSWRPSSSPQPRLRAVPAAAAVRAKGEAPTWWRSRRPGPKQPLCDDILVSGRWRDLVPELLERQPPQPWRSSVDGTLRCKVPKVLRLGHSRVCGARKGRARPINVEGVRRGTAMPTQPVRVQAHRMKILRRPDPCCSNVFNHARGLGTPSPEAASG